MNSEQHSDVAGNVHDIPPGSLPGAATAAFESIVGDISPELLKLVRDTRAAFDKSEEVQKRRDDMIAANLDRPLPPEALFRRPADFGIFHGFCGRPFTEAFWTGYKDLFGRLWYGGDQEIAYLKGDGLASCAHREEMVDGELFERPFDLKKTTRIAEILKAREQWDAEIAQFRERVGITAVNAAAEQAYVEMEALYLQFGSHRARTLLDVIAKASVCYDSRAEVEEQQAWLEKEHSGFELVEKSIALDLQRMMYDGGLAELFSATSSFTPIVATTTPDRRALESYRTWLENEFRCLTVEMYPDHPEMLGIQAKGNAGDRMHWRGEPPPSTRAERVLTMFGLDWRQDPEPFQSRAAEQAA